MLHLDCACRSWLKIIIDESVAEALKLVNMGGFIDRRVTDLSGGEQQRVALARALAPQTAVIDAG